MNKVVAPSAKNMTTKEHAQSVVYSLQNEDGTAMTTMRLTDGYVNLTLMTRACRKKLKDYTRLKSSQEYMQGLSEEVGMNGPSSLVQQVHGKGSQQATWGHPELAIDVAGWCSVKFKLKVNRLVTRYFKGELTTEESKAAAELLPAAVQPTQDALCVADWECKRDVAKELTKAKSKTIHIVTGGQARGDIYGSVNSALTKSVAGKAPKALQAMHSFKDTPRNHMPESMLGLLAYGERAVDTDLLSKHKELGRFLTGSEVSEIAWRVTDKIYDMCKSTGGFAVPLLKACPAPAGQKRKATKCMLLQPSKQQKLIACH